ncbi:hypothetical protein FA13DRAFT_1714729 [Coprinellus micaceus]|uniref:Uncharacterized protein n=1 Tax=Coprinellus micaceus TaxID=71717 RepID=A0A4Y7SS44_COPMI|nr:hypothetical protein FA13DRAFT_1714729 [Coprinellus micaceus]
MSIPPPPRKRIARGLDRYHPYSREESTMLDGDDSSANPMELPAAVSLIGASIKQERDGDDVSVLRTARPDVGSRATGSREGGLRAHKRQFRSGTPSGPNPITQSGPTRSATKAATQAAKFAAEIEVLKGRIRELESSERRLRDKLAIRGELLKDARGEREEARTECVKVEEALEEKEKTLEAVTNEANRYRGWWLTDYYSLKVVLGLVPNKEDVEAIASASRDRFITYSAALRQHQ